jgi:ribosome-binding protein aMBF1 (putative translation factor)
MFDGMRGGSIIREGRRRSGLSQRELAQRLNTSQAAIARWESGAVKPTVESVGRALAECGLELQISLVPVDDHDAGLDREHVRLTPDQRLRRLENHVALILEGRRQMVRA